MRRLHTGSPGQAIAEFSVVLPIVLIMLVALFDLGRVIWAADVTAHAASEAARWAIVRGGSTSNTCPVGPPAGAIAIPPPSAACPHPSPSKQSIVDRALEAAAMTGGVVQAQACYGSGCQGDADVPGAVNSRGTEMTVTVRADLDLMSTALLSPILGRSTFDVVNSSTMKVNN